MEAIKLSVEIESSRRVTLELPQNIPTGKAEVMVIVQSLTNRREKKRGEVDLASRGIDPKLAAEMRNRLISFEEDWNAPGMEIYDEL